MTWLLAALLGSVAPSDTGYEDRLVDWALTEAHRELEPNPEGKQVEDVVVLTEDVISPSDPYPNFLNWFHKTTREPVVRREVLLNAGDSWNGRRAQETERNLRRLFFIAVAKVVAAKGQNGGVVMVVATKDKGSRRLSNSVTLIGSLLQFLSLQLTEADFNGWGQSLSLGMNLRLDTVSITETFIERRVAGSRFYLGETAALVFSRATGALEGTSGEVTLGQPLITLDQDWAYLLDTTWNSRRRRVFRGASIWQLPYPDAAGSETVPFVYDVREFASELSGTRSFGRALKVEITGALGGYVRQYTPPKESNLTDDQRAWFISSYLPRSETATYLAAYFRAFPADFRVLHNIDTFELSEDYQIGWLAQAGARWAFPLPFAPSNFVELGASLRYRFYEKDDLFTVTVASGVRIRPGSSPANKRLAAEISNYSPAFWGGRLVTRLLIDLIDNDLDHRQLLLGGSTGLRGTVAEQFTGRNLLLGNAEYRAKPFEVLSSWLGLVFFYDVGSAFDSLPSLTHTIGVGLRILLPQLNREVIRIDFGLVLGGSAPGADRINASWGQVTDLRPAFLDQPY